VPLILKRAPFDPNREDYNVLEGGVLIGRIFLSPAAPQDRPWMWASGHNGDIRRAAHGYEPTREQICRHSRGVGTGSRRPPLPGAIIDPRCAVGRRPWLNRRQRLHAQSTSMSVVACGCDA
jgi:hypothetical protein